MPTIGALWRHWRDVLAAQGFDSPALDAKLLAAHALGLDTLALATRETETVDPVAAARLAELLERRLAGQSVARLIGEREFYGLPFWLNEATLEPRPDTELLVDLALAALPRGGRILDLGTGTGCIPIAILANRPDVSGLATDLVADALAIARRNAERNGVANRLSFAHGNWFDAVEDHAGFDLIVSNPPYIASAVIETLDREVKAYDPRLALDGGPDGLAPYRTIAVHAAEHLREGGQLLVEIGFDQSEAVVGLFESRGLSAITVHKDLAGLDRVVGAHHIVTKDSKA